MVRKKRAQTTDSQQQPEDVQKVHPTRCLRLCDLYIELSLLFLLGIVPLVMTGRYSSPLNLKEALGQLVIFTALFVFLIRVLLSGRIVIPKAPQWLPLGGIVLYALLSLMFTPAKRTAFRDFLLFFNSIAVLVLFAVYLRKRRFLWMCLLVATLSATFVALGGLLQYTGVYLPFLPTPAPGSVERTWSSSTIGHNNGVAVVLMLTCFAPILFLLRSKTWPARALSFLVIFLMFFLMLICQTRAVWLSLPIGLVLFLGIAFRRQLWGRGSLKTWGRVAAGIAVVLVLAFAYYQLTSETKVGTNIPTLRERLSHFSPDILIKNTRTRIAAIGAFMVKDHWLRGHGFGSFKYVYPRYQADFFERFPNSPLDPTGRHTDRAHNEYLQTWIELGLPGLLMGFWLIFAHGKFALVSLRRKLPFEQLVLLAAGAGACLSLLIVNIASFEFHVMTSAMLFVFWTALMIQIGSRNQNWVCNIGAYGGNRWLQSLTIIAGGWFLILGGTYTTKNIQADHYFRLGRYYRDKGYEYFQNNDLDKGFQFALYGAERMKKGTQLAPYYGFVGYEYGQVLSKIGEAFLIRKQDGESARKYFSASISVLRKTKEEYEYKGLQYSMGRSYAFLYYLTKMRQFADLAEQHLKEAFRIFPKATDAYHELGRL